MRIEVIWSHSKLSRANRVHRVSRIHRISFCFVNNFISWSIRFFKFFSADSNRTILFLRFYLFQQFAVESPLLRANCLSTNLFIASRSLKTFNLYRIGFSLMSLERLQKPVKSRVRSCNQQWITRDPIINDREIWTTRFSGKNLHFRRGWWRRILPWHRVWSARYNVAMKYLGRATYQSESRLSSPSHDAALPPRRRSAVFRRRRTAAWS